MKKVKFLLVLLFVLTLELSAQERNEIYFPDILEYKTLKCDFHTHTVFSDGLVWPTIRVEEAWRDGLDAIAITDHLEYLPHKADIKTNRNRSYQIASQSPYAQDVMVIHAAEITRNMPPGHLNALFISDAEIINKDEAMAAVKAAHEQNAFIIWNHPAWKAQQPDTVRWFEEHTELYESGMLHGIEVVNYHQYSPEALKWAMEKKLTPIAASDIHGLIHFQYPQQHRPLTLVFAKEKTREALREALFAHRSVAFYDNFLYGEPKYLKPLFHNSLQYAENVAFRESGRTPIALHNASDVGFELKATGSKTKIGYSDLTVPAHKTAILWLKPKEKLAQGEKISLKFSVQNLLHTPEKPIEVELKFQAK